MKRIDITGQKFGKWTAIKYAGSYNKTYNGKKGGYSLWECQCECGNTKEVSLSTLRAGISTNCGCTKYDTRKTQFAETDFKPGDTTKHLIIISRADDVKSKSGRINKRYNAMCTCGNACIVWKLSLSQNGDISCPDCAKLKAAKKMNTTKFTSHWKTGQEIVCVGSYELKVVNWLNANKMEFTWKPKTFSLPSGKRYTPDLFIDSLNSYIEIKGWWWNSKSYFDEFVAANIGKIELWNKKKLQALGLLK